MDDEREENFHGKRNFYVTRRGYYKLGFWVINHRCMSRSSQPLWYRCRGEAERAGERGGGAAQFRSKRVATNGLLIAQFNRNNGCHSIWRVSGHTRLLWLWLKFEAKSSEVETHVRITRLNLAFLLPLKSATPQPSHPRQLTNRQSLIHWPKCSFLSNIFRNGNNCEATPRLRLVGSFRTNHQSSRVVPEWTIEELESLVMIQ